MTNLARRSNAPLLDARIQKTVHAAFDGFAKALSAQVNAVVAHKAIEKKVSAAMPALLEQAFITEFLEDKDASRRRALLAHLLTTAELQNLSEPPLVEAPALADAADTELTSEAAAKLLHVSRTHLNALVDAGQLGEVRRTAGRHRRISKAAVLRYKEASRQRQTQGLDDMMAATQRLGLYERELEGVPVRGKR